MKPLFTVEAGTFIVGSEIQKLCRTLMSGYQSGTLALISW